MPVDLVDWKKIGARVNGAELLDLAVAPGGEQPERQFADRNFLRAGRRAAPSCSGAGFPARPTCSSM